MCTTSDMVHKPRSVRIVVYSDGMASTKAGAIAVRVDEELLARIDAAARQMSTEWMETSRSDVVRACLLAGLPIVEAHAKRFAAAGKVTEKRGKARK